MPEKTIEQKALDHLNCLSHFAVKQPGALLILQLLERNEELRQKLKFMAIKLPEVYYRRDLSGSLIEIASRVYRLSLVEREGFNGNGRSHGVGE